MFFAAASSEGDTKAVQFVGCGTGSLEAYYSSSPNQSMVYVCPSAVFIAWS